MIRKLLHNPQAVLGLFLIFTILICAIFAPLLAPNDPAAIHITNKFQNASSEYPLGTDQLGRCILSRLIYGARYSLGLSIPILVILAFIGTVLGALTGWIGGIFDHVILIICDIFMAFPPLVIVLALMGIMRKGTLNLIISILLSMWVWYVKIIRSFVLVEKEKDYITAARLSGCKSKEIIIDHILRNIAPMLVVYFSTGIASIILMISGYSFLGLGLSGDLPEWGSMLNQAKQYLYANPSLILHPGACIFLTATGFNLFGEALRDVLSPREG